MVLPSRTEPPRRRLRKIGVGLSKAAPTHRSSHGKNNTPLGARASMETLLPTERDDACRTPADMRFLPVLPVTACLVSKVGIQPRSKCMSMRKLCPASSHAKAIKRSIAPWEPRPVGSASVARLSIASSMEPMQLSLGRLEELLSHGVRLRPCSLQDGAVVCDSSSDLFFAPLFEVAGEVLNAARSNPYLSPCCAGFRSQGAEILVQFSPDSSGAGAFMALTTERRARAVQLYAGKPPEGTQQRQDLSTPASAAAVGCYDKDLEVTHDLDIHSVTAFDVASRWKCAGHRIEAGAWTELPSVLDQWHWDAINAVKCQDGVAVCRTLRKAFHFLTPRSMNSFREAGKAHTSVAFMSKVLDELWARQVWGVEIRLRAIITFCIAHMDFTCPNTRAACRESIPFRFKGTRHYIWQYVWRGMKHPAGFGRLQYRRVLRLCHKIKRTQGPLVGQHVTRWCKVFGCKRRARVKVHTVDRWGEPGFRCGKHASRGTCNVQGCINQSLCRTYEDDEFGRCGHRCFRHGARRCQVPGCKRASTVRAQFADEHGPPGRRCWMHGLEHSTPNRVCNVLGCSRQSRGFRCIDDEFGTAGRRCCSHHGKSCDVAGCEHPAIVQKAMPKDKFGPAGKRCKYHSIIRLCCAIGCGALALHQSLLDKGFDPTVQHADEYGPPGPRCYLHGGRACEVRSCGRKPWRVVLKSDEFGKPGLRCRAHSSPRRRPSEGNGLNHPRCGVWGDLSGRELLAKAEAADALLEDEPVEAAPWKGRRERGCGPALAVGRGAPMADAGLLGKVTLVRHRAKPVGNETALFRNKYPGTTSSVTTVFCSRAHSENYVEIVRTLRRYALQGQYDKQDLLKMKKCMLQRSHQAAQS